MPASFVGTRPITVAVHQEKVWADYYVTDNFYRKSWGQSTDPTLYSLLLFFCVSLIVCHSEVAPQSEYYFCFLYLLLFFFFLLNLRFKFVFLVY
jgi:hypothetical protein